MHRLVRDAATCLKGSHSHSPQFYGRGGRSLDRGSERIDIPRRDDPAGLFVIHMRSKAVRV